jgi:hypothetical protein
MTDKKKEETVPSKEMDQDTAAHDYIKKKWVDKDPEIVPEACKTGRCGHKEHQIKHEKGD